MLDEHAQRELHVEPREPDLIQRPERAPSARFGAMSIDVPELASGLESGRVVGEAGADEMGGPELEVVIELRTNLRLDVLPPERGAMERTKPREDCASGDGRAHCLS
jgi:hypothetical protein